jgi:hypothetical protein
MLSKPQENLSVVARRVLPAVRLYSYWVAEHSDTLLQDSAEPMLQQRVEEMWRVYAAFLTKAVSLSLAKVDTEYLLEEDSDVVGYLPLITERTRDQWYVNEQLRPRFSDQGVERHPPAKEALMRVKDLVHAAAKMVIKNVSDSTGFRVLLHAC